MRRAGIVLVVWGCWLGLATALQSPFGPRLIETLMLGSAALGSVVTGLVVWRLDARRPLSLPSPRLLTETSFATATLVAGLATVAVGLAFGLWLVLMGLIPVALGAGGVAREWRGMRRVRARAERRA